MILSDKEFLKEYTMAQNTGNNSSHKRSKLKELWTKPENEGMDWRTIVLYLVFFGISLALSQSDGVMFYKLIILAFAVVNVAFSSSTSLAINLISGHDPKFENGSKVKGNLAKWILTWNVILFATTFYKLFMDSMNWSLNLPVTFFCLIILSGFQYAIIIVINMTCRKVIAYWIK